MARQILSILLMLAISACSTMQAVQSSNVTEFSQHVKVGDQVLVSLVDGRTYDVKVSAYGRDGFTGIDRDGSKHKFVYPDVQSIEVKKINGTKTTALVVGIVAGVFALALLGMGVFAKGVEEYAEGGGN